MERVGFDRIGWLLKPDRTRNLLLFVSSAIVALCLLEFGLRQFAPPRDIAAGTLNTPKAALYGWALSPNEEMTFVDPDTGEIWKYYTNSEGWKDVQHQFVKPEGYSGSCSSGIL